MINFNQLVFFAPFMSLWLPSLTPLSYSPLLLPSLTFLVLQTLSYAVGDLYILVYIYNSSLGRIFSELSGHSFSSNFEAMGKT